MSSRHASQLEAIYVIADGLLKANKKVIPPKGLLQRDIDLIDSLFLNIENNKGINNVLITSLIEKVVNPKQDIRYHQAKMKNGYSGRTLDTNYVTPFLKSKNLLTMVESGWLTRSLEQNAPYDLSFPGAIRPQSMKITFLEILDHVENHKTDASLLLTYYFEKLIILRESKKIVITPLVGIKELSIKEVIIMLKLHLKDTSGAGKSKLPVLAMYAVIQLLMAQVLRYKDKTLSELESHTSPDARSRAVGDIQIVDSATNVFEGYEIKYDKPLTYEMVLDAYEKVKATTTKRYFILTTGSINDIENIDTLALLQSIEDQHGCEFILGDLFEVLARYLALVQSTNNFVDFYSNLIQTDAELKIDHKETWEKIILDSNYKHGR